GENAFFFGPNSPHSTDAVYDGHVVFDMFGGRYIVIAEDFSTNSWLVRVSSGHDASSWCATQMFDAMNHNGENSVDFPLVGYSYRYVTMTAVTKFSGAKQGNKVSLVL